MFKVHLKYKFLLQRYEYQMYEDSLYKKRKRNFTAIIAPEKVFFQILRSVTLL